MLRATVARLFAQLPLLAAVIVLVTATPFAWSRDLGIFLICILFYLPIIIIACIILLVMAFKPPMGAQRLPILLTVAVIATLTPTAFTVIPPIRDPVGFFVWYKMHRNLIAKFKSHDGIVVTWDQWGWAGNENDSYLVSNPSDDIAEIDPASRWIKGQGFQCDAAYVERMMHGLYILTTYNCPLE
jgi:hypothetical protein